jgi:hypothetical protein
MDLQPPTVRQLNDTLKTRTVRDGLFLLQFPAIVADESFVSLILPLELHGARIVAL